MITTEKILEETEKLNRNLKRCVVEALAALVENDRNKTEKILEEGISLFPKTEITIK